MKKALTLIFVTFGFLCSGQGSDESLRRQLEFVNFTKDYREGYKASTGSNDFKYHSIRSDVAECLLTRATDGNMSIEWITSPVEEEIEGEGIGFLWIAAMDITPSNHQFAIYLNDKKYFTLSTGNVADWTIQHEEGGFLRFYTIEKDHHGDAHGYMALWAPESWLIPGQSQKIRITGEAAGSSAWIIVYKAMDAVEFLQKSVIYDKWISLRALKKKNKYEITFLLPGYFAGESLFYFSEGQNGEISTTLDGKYTRGAFELSNDAWGKPFTLKDTEGELVAVENLGIPGSSTKLLSKAILKVEQKTDEGQHILIEAQRIYHPKTVQSLIELSKSNLSAGRIYLMNSSHQDIAWMDSPEKCMLERDTMLLTPLFDLASGNPDYRFDVEDALMLREYIDRHPDKKSLIREMLTDGRLSCGSTFIQPYEEMYSGESLARQFYFGAKWLKKEFGYQAHIYWNVDIPGRTLQMPQIMKKSGTDFLMMSRFEKGIYHWYGPDGSRIMAFSPGHYADAFIPLQKNFYEAAQYLGSSSLFWSQYYGEKSSGTVIPVLSDWDMSPAVDYTPLVARWESISELQNEDGDFIPVSLPTFTIASGDEFFNSLAKGITNIPSLKGERPAIWLYIHGPSHQKALKASREGDIILTQAEKFATVNAWVDGSFKKYPENELNKAWEAKIYPDHGWGGKNGEITDHLFLQKFLFSRDEGEKILERNLQDLASKVRTDPKKGIPLIVFNSLSWSRSDVVDTRIFFDPGEASGIVMKDGYGKRVPIQITEKELYNDGSLKSVEICFIARNVPSVGYKTYYLSPGSSENSPSQGADQMIENSFYRVKFGKGGLESIFDKEIQKELIDASKFKAGEVFTMRSLGNGAGEFADVQQPDMEGFDKTGYYQTDWEIIHEGPVFTSCKMRQPIRNAVVEQEVIVYHDLKRIDFKTELLNWEGILYREYRMALPLNMTDGQVVYEVPYAALKVGTDELEGNAGERYVYPCRETRPRGIQNWIGAYNRDISVILSSTVAVADYQDPTENPIPNQMLQPILLASRKSCHGEGNDYLQTGDHSFLFSLTSTRPDWRKGYKSALQVNEPLRSIVAPDPYLRAGLPEEKSFLSLDASNVIITTLKKAEDNQNSVIRMVEMEGADSEVALDIFKPLDQLYQTNLIEETVREINIGNKLRLEIGRHAIETFSLK